jgi:transcriptional regulator with XRE-family HTH domain
MAQIQRLTCEEFGENFRRLRRAAGILQKHLAAKLGVSPDTVSHWARGKALPESAHLARLAELLHVSTDQLLADNTVPRQQIPVLGRATGGPLAPEADAKARTIRLEVGGVAVTITVEPAAKPP